MRIYTATQVSSRSKTIMTQTSNVISFQIISGYPTTLCLKSLGKIIGQHAIGYYAAGWNQLTISPQTIRTLKSMAVFVEHFPPFLGSDRSIFELATRAARHGIAVKFIALQPLRYLLGHRPRHWEYKKYWSQTSPSVNTPPNVTVEHIFVGSVLERMWRRLPFLAFPLTVCLFVIESLMVLSSCRPRLVVVAHASPLLGVVGSICAKLTLRPLVMGCPDWMAAYAAELVRKKLSSFGPMLLHWLEMQLYRHSDAIYVVTRYLQHLLVHNGVRSERIHIVPNGVDIRAFSPDVDGSVVRERYHISKETCVILFTGHLEHWAGLRLLPHLVRRLNSEMCSSKILLVGEGQIASDVRSELAQHGLDHMLVLTGPQPFEEMPRFVAAADIALCLFPDTPLSHAASPLKLFEYMSAAKAIVATRVAGTAEILCQGSGVLVAPDSVEEICDAVIRLCKDAKLRRELGQKARETVVDYDWDVLLYRFLNCCVSALDHHARP